MNKTEYLIQQFFKSIFITCPEQLNINTISSALKIDVIYWEFSSEAVFYQNRCKIFLNKDLSPQQKWQEFGHESCHIFQHVGRQENMYHPFLLLQEYQANYFAYHFCIPTFMLELQNDLSLNTISHVFNVEEEFAFRRLEIYQNNLQGVYY